MPDRGVGRRPDAAGEEKHLVAFDQFARHLDRLWRRIAVVIRDKGDLAPVHPALVVDHLEVRGHRYRERAGVRERTAVGAGVADLDLAVGDARPILLGCAGRPGGRQLATKCQRNRGDGENSTTCQTLHDDLPFASLLFKSLVCIPWVRDNGVWIARRPALGNDEALWACDNCKVANAPSYLPVSTSACSIVGCALQVPHSGALSQIVAKSWLA